MQDCNPLEKGDRHLVDSILLSFLGGGDPSAGGEEGGSRLWPSAYGMVEVRAWEEEGLREEGQCLHQVR